MWCCKQTRSIRKVCAVTLQAVSRVKCEGEIHDIKLFFDRCKTVINNSFAKQNQLNKL